eukprot:1694807-Rhodomonas_salina.3
MDAAAIATWRQHPRHLRTGMHVKRSLTAYPHLSSRHTCRKTHAATSFPDLLRFRLFIWQRHPDVSTGHRQAKAEHGAGQELPEVSLSSSSARENPEP